MCKIINDLSEVAFAKGEAKGKSEGIAQGEERFALLTQKLCALGRVNDVQRISVDKDYRNLLMKEFAIQ